jgi:Xaa-Pro aminopeptidase
MTDRRRPAKARNGAPPGTPAARLAALRHELKRRRLDGFVVPRSDEHQGEYVPPCAERLAWLTGFTGSAGLAIALTDRAAVFVDGRYTLQVAAQVDASLYELRHVTDQPPEQWLAGALKTGARLGIDPWLHTPAGVERLAAACRKAGAELVRTDNAVDAAWTDRPAPPRAPVVPHELAFAGRDSASKRAEIASALAADKVGAVVLTLPESIAWLLNVRGGDVAHSPLPLCFAILHSDAQVDLFLDPAKIAPGLADHLGKTVALRAPTEFGPALDALGRARARVQADPATAADWVFQRLTAAGADIVRATDPCLLPKACKNEVELNGARAAHRRDGAALTRFLAWLASAAPAGTVTEIAAADRLEAIRRESNLFRDLSFDTISGAGPNGAIVHYRVTEQSNRRLEPGSLYLVDSGAQYPDGTTDVTRTVAVGAAPAAAREHFTRVLKGHIALAAVRFPKGTTGPQLDALARRPLWEAGLDYDHGTGHGVGSYLGVHEGPQSISKRQNSVALRPGMIVSNEPGYYRTGAYGIRIENLVVVQPVAADGGSDMLGFETLTLAPIDRALVEPGLMTEDEIGWLDAYHARVRETLTPLIDGETAGWLAEATRPLAAN